MIKRKIHHKVLILIGAIIICFYSLTPIAWIVSTSFKRPDVIFSNPPQWIPKSPTLENYAHVIENPAMIQYFKNTVIVSLTSTIFAVIIAISPPGKK